MSEAAERLAKFVRVMRKKFLHSTEVPYGKHQDAFFGVEVGGPDEAEVRVSDIEALLTERDEARVEVEDLARLLEKQSDILRRTANALHGGPLKDGYWSHHDLPELAARLREALLHAIQGSEAVAVWCERDSRMALRFARKLADDTREALAEEKR